MQRARGSGTTQRDVTLPQLLADAVRLFRREFIARMTGVKLTPALARLLFYVHRDPGSRQIDLAARLEITPVALGRMLDRLARRGYVRRAPDPEDRRAFRVFIDRAGEPLVGRMEEIRKVTESQATKGLSARDRTQLLGLLKRVCDNLSSEDA